MYIYIYVQYIRAHMYIYTYIHVMYTFSTSPRYVGSAKGTLLNSWMTSDASPVGVICDPRSAGPWQKNMLAHIKFLEIFSIKTINMILEYP